MATNRYFRNYTSPNEQNLMDDLVIESVKSAGIDTYYVARTLVNEDKILNDNSVNLYDRAFVTEMYVKSFDGFQGQGDFMSKFGGPLIKDQLTLSIPIRTFDRNVKNFHPELVRPREGDLVYYPLNKKFFEVTFVEHESVFYQAGTLFVYDLKCELMEFSNQQFQTGIELIDQYSVEFKTDDVTDLETLYERDPISKNFFFDLASDDLIDDSEFDPFKNIVTSVTRGQ